MINIQNIISCSPTITSNIIYCIYKLIKNYTWEKNNPNNCERKQEKPPHIIMEYFVFSFPSPSLYDYKPSKN